MFLWAVFGKGDLKETKFLAFFNSGQKQKLKAKPYRVFTQRKTVVILPYFPT